MLNHFPLFPNKNLSEKLTNHARVAFQKSFEIAYKQNMEKIEGIHLLYAIYLEKGSAGSIILKDFGIKLEHFKKFLTKKSTKKKLLPTLDEKIKKTILKSFALAKEMSYPYVGTEHLVYALLISQDKKIEDIFSLLPNPALPFFSAGKKLSIELDESLPPSSLDPNHITSSSFSPNIFETIFSKNESKKHPGRTPYLDKFCTNLNNKVEEEKETIIGREAEVERIVSILGRKNKNNPLLVGFPGVGKTALAYKLAQLINNNDVPSFLLGKRIMSLDIAALIAGTGFRGEFESRLKEIIKETVTDKNVILFIDEIHNIIGAGNISGSLDLANILKPALSRREIQVIGATTQREFKKYIEKDAALERRFQPVVVREPSLEETRQILLGIKVDYENFHKVIISPEALELSLELSHRYIRDRFLPDKALDILDETAAILRAKRPVSSITKKIQELELARKSVEREKEKILQEENYEKAIEIKNLEKEIIGKIKNFQESQKQQPEELPIIIKADDIIATVAKISGVSLEKLSKTKTQKIKNVFQILSARIIGQNEVLEKISSTLIRSQFGLNNPDRPLGSFLFLGPSGVGKSLTGKVLAQEFFLGNKSLIKFDMSEFMERHSVSALIGSPAGYIGYGEGGRLTERVRQNPYSVILFDEVEKAHPDVANLLLQILDEGILTDAEGTEVSFKNCIIILTTNIGTEEFNALPVNQLGFQTEKKSESLLPELETIKENIMADLEERLRPEIFNRLDHIVVFNPLSPQDIEKITNLELAQLKERLKKQQIILNCNKGAIRLIAKKSLAPMQGARLIRKKIQEMIEDPLARMVMEEKIKDGKITVSTKQKTLVLK